MTDKKTYRTHWTIEPAYNPYNVASHQIQWYRGSIDMDNVHYCSTVEEAEREIDDAIILEQEQVIERFRDALLASNVMLTNTLYANALFSNAELDLLKNQINDNDRLIKSFQL